MSNEYANEYELLGPAEAHIAKTMAEAIGQTAQTVTRVQDSLEKLSGVDFEALMLDSGKKKLVVEMAGPIAAMPQQLANTALALMMITAILRPEAQVK